MIPQQMQASVVPTYGDPDVIRQERVAVPTPGPDDVLIQVAATSFNPADGLIRGGLLQAMLPLALPYTPGVDVAGVVAAVGSAVTDFQPGARVFAMQDLTRQGAAAEYVACRTAVVAAAPAGLPLVEAAALPAAGLTAWQALFEHGHLQAGQRVLLTAAGGGVGTLAVQLAKWKGAYVLGTGSVRSATLLQELGVDELIDYTRQQPTEAITQPVDLIVNLAPLATPDVNQLLTLLKPGGVLVSAVQPADEAEAERLGVRAVRMAVRGDAGQLTELTQLVEQGHLKPVITERRPVSELAAAHREAGHTHGKVVLVVNKQLG